MSSPAAYASAMDLLGEMVDAVAETDRIVATAMSWRVEQIDQARILSEQSVQVTTSVGMSPWTQAETARRTLVSELAAAQRIPERSAERLVDESRVLVHDLPATLAQLRLGKMSYRHAQVMVDQASTLPGAALPEFEASALPFASQLTVTKFERKARTIRERMEPDTILERHEKCVEDRHVELHNAADGMAWLNLYLPAVTAHAIHNRITDIARSQQSTSETRTLAQLRADAAVSQLLGNVPGESTTKPWVAITVPVLSLLGHSDEPPTLDGYGPIDIGTARTLCGEATSFVRILTHPETGAVLSVGRDRYSVPADMRKWLQTRDETCRAPGCNVAARRCDIDHTQEWQNGGQTSHDNLAHLCPKHHAMKHHTGWSMEHADDGSIEWTSPSGRRYRT